MQRFLKQSPYYCGVCSDPTNLSPIDIYAGQLGKDLTAGKQPLAYEHRDIDSWFDE